MTAVLDLDELADAIALSEAACPIVAPRDLEEAIAAVVEEHLTGKGQAADDKRKKLVDALATELMGLPVHQVYVPEARVEVDVIQLGNASIGVDANGDLVEVTVDRAYVCWDFRD